MVQWLAGEDITASKLSTTRLTARSDGDQAVTTSVEDVTGALLTITTTRDDVTVDAEAVCDFRADSSSPNTGVGIVRLDVDGSTETEEAHFDCNVSLARATVTQRWSTVTLAAAGSHTLKLVVLRSGGSTGDLDLMGVHTKLTLVVEDNV